MSNRITFDAERVQFNTAWIKKGGEHFEIAIDPDLAVRFKSGQDVKIEDVIKSEHIFSDVRKGLLASEDKMNTVFGTAIPIDVAKILLSDGDIQFTQEYRIKLQEQKRKQIIELIHAKGVDPRTGLPHPTQRIENAFEEAKIKIDYFKRAEEQIEGIVKKIRPILPIRFETKKIEVSVGVDYASKIYGVLSNFGKILDQIWGSDGGLKVILEIPAGLQNEFYDKINGLTHGDNETKVIE